MNRKTFLLLVFALTACSDPASAPQDVATKDAPAPSVRLSERCTNTQYGFTISFPERWHTNDGAVLPACSAFDPAPVQVPQASELPFSIAVAVTVQETSIEQLTRSSQWERVLSAAPTTIAGRQGFRVEVEATGEGLADRGMRTTRYVSELADGRILVASTHSVTPQYASNTEILRRMVESLKLV